MATVAADDSCDRSRRQLLAAAGGGALGLLLGFHLTARAAAADAAPRPFDAWIRFGPDGRVVLLVAKAEMGQGVLTALPMLLAEELGIDLDLVEVRQAPIDPSTYEHLTVGSHSIQSLWQPLRQAGAQARALLEHAAARRWRLPIASCRAAAGRVSAAGGYSATYAELAQEAAALPAPVATLKARHEYQLIGRPRRRVDAPDKVAGAAVYGVDVRLPGMLYAVIARAPRLGARLRSCEADAARSVAGVTAVLPVAPQGFDAFTRGGVAVVAENSWAALEARRRLRLSWDDADGSGTSSAQLRAALRAKTRANAALVTERGDAPGALRHAGRQIEATYELPFLAHATLEPMNATVLVKPARVEAWLPTQNAAAAREAIARTLGRPVAAVQVHQTLLGGGFGRRDATDFAVEAAQIAAACSQPVQLLFSREDDFQFGRYRPMAVHRLRAALDARGLPRAWLHRLSSTSIAAFLEPPATAEPASTEVGGARELPYDVPAFRMEYAPQPCALPVGWWRSVEDSLNAFAVESFIDELARAAGRDPLQYRLALLAPGGRVQSADGTAIEGDRLRRVLLAVGEQCAWPSAAPPGRARGLACHACRGSYIAVVAEVCAADAAAAVRRIWAAVDCGTVINPLGLEAQIEGGLLFGTSAALYESITLEHGAVQQTNFDSYPVLRLDACPRLEVLILPSEAPPGGAGEIAVPVVAPAIANAWHALSGRRLRRLPLRQR